MNRSGSVASIDMRSSRLTQRPEPEHTTDRHPSPFRAISLGGGVQSSVLTLMAAQGLFDATPDAAIHADTGWDPPETLQMVKWLTGAVNFPVHVTQSRKGSLTDAVALPVGPTAFVPIPTYTDSGGMGRRQCTREYKIEPIERLLRSLLNVKPRHRIPEGSVEQWIGFSTDEIVRVKPNATPWIKNRYPLIEANMSRTDCVRWWHAHAPGDAPELARSSCVGCPYHTAAEWVHLAEHNSDMIDEAAEIETMMQHAESQTGRSYKSFLHRRRIPLKAAIKLDQRQIEWQNRQGVLFEESDEQICGDGCFT